MKITRVVKIPVEFYDHFKNDPDTAWRSFGDIPQEAEYPFFNDRQAIHDMIQVDRKNPFDGRTMEFDADFECKDDYYRFIHIDLGHTGDACGISMCCVKDWKLVEVKREEEGSSYIEQDFRPVFDFDFLGRLTATEMEGEEIIFQDVRNLVYKLNERGFPIALITFDRFNSVDSIQLLRKRSFVVANLSLDRTTTYPVLDIGVVDGYKKESTSGMKYATILAWNTFKEAMNTRRVRLPFYLPVMDTAIVNYEKEKAIDDFGKKMKEVDYITWVEQEALSATFDSKKMKVMENPGSSIDLLESVAGSVFNASNNVTDKPEEESEMARMKRLAREKSKAATDFEREDADYLQTGEDDSILDKDSWDD